MNTDQDQAIADTLAIIKTYIDNAIANTTTQSVEDLKLMAAKLIQLRTAKKKSVARIGVLLNQPAQHVKDLEAGKVALTKDEAAVLAAFYGVAVDYLVY